MSFRPFKTILEFIAKDQIEPTILIQNDYLRLENKILKEQLETGMKLNNEHRRSLAELGFKIKEINKSIFEQSIQIVKPETLLRWHDKFVKRKFDGSKNRNPDAP
jgi:hypothetical protein